MELQFQHSRYIWRQVLQCTTAPYDQSVFRPIFCRSADCAELTGGAWRHRHVRVSRRFSQAAVQATSAPYHAGTKAAKFLQPKNLWTPLRAVALYIQELLAPIWIGLEAYIALKTRLLFAALLPGVPASALSGALSHAVPPDKLAVNAVFETPDPGTFNAELAPRSNGVAATARQ